MPHLILSYSLLAALLLLGACANTRNPTADSPALPGSAWALVAMPGELPEQAAISLAFDEKGLSGRGVCNRYFAGCEIAGNQLTVQPIGATRMMCPAHAEVEQRYFDLLGKAEKYAIKKDQLSIYTSEGELVFSRTEEE